MPSASCSTLRAIWKWCPLFASPFFLFSLSLFSKAKKNHRHDPVCITRSMGEKRKLYFYISRRLDCGPDFQKNKFSFPQIFLSFPLTRETKTKKRQASFAKLQYLIKIIKTPISQKWLRQFFMCQMAFICITVFFQFFSWVENLRDWGNFFFRKSGPV